MHLLFIAQGIGVATVYYGDIEPDFKEGIKFGIRGHYLKPGTLQPAPDECGANSAWSWGLNCAIDYFETDKRIDSKRMALFGVSRLGKTVLWTGARDMRFKMIIASCSGEGGGASSLRDYSENIKHLTDASHYFYQFAANDHSYASRIHEFPVDAHMLIALIAPRPFYLRTGYSDNWSDPKGEFLAAVETDAGTSVFAMNVTVDSFDDLKNNVRIRLTKDILRELKLSNRIETFGRINLLVPKLPSSFVYFPPLAYSIK